jgi:vancomycin resistance protein YoaR
MSETELHAAVQDLARERAGSPIVLTRAPSPTEGEASVEVTRAQLGYRLNVDATVDAVMERGRQTNPLAALADHLTAFGGTISVEASDRIDAGRQERQLAAIARQLVTPPREGDLRFSGKAITRVDPAPGARLDSAELRERVRRAVLSASTKTVVIPTEPLEPRTDASDVDEVLAQGRRAISGPIRLARGSAALTITARQIASVLDVRVTPQTDASLALVANENKVAAIIDERSDALESDPVDATFQLAGAGVEIIPAQDGFSVSAAKTAPQVLEAALSDRDRTAPLKGKSVEADFSTRDARALNIDERVSSFTTYHDCCESRVENIHRIADLVDGSVVMPGETFSINENIGPRTAARGFVEAPAILNGEYVEEVGGGVSQFATTLFNAIFFGGYDFLEYKAHSYYIDRYPRGREATVSDPSPDLEFLNDSDAGIYVDTSYTDTSITVAFYGSTDVEVDAVMGRPYNYRPSPREYEINRSLERGESRVLQAGSSGFDVVVKRVLTYPGGEQEVEDFFTRYLPVPEIVERGPRR